MLNTIRVQSSAGGGSGGGYRRRLRRPFGSSSSYAGTMVAINVSRSGSTRTTSYSWQDREKIQSFVPEQLSRFYLEIAERLTSAYASNETIGIDEVLDTLGLSYVTGSDFVLRDFFSRVLLGDFEVALTRFCKVTSAACGNGSTNICLAEIIRNITRVVKVALPFLANSEDTLIKCRDWLVNTVGALKKVGDVYDVQGNGSFVRRFLTLLLDVDSGSSLNLLNSLRLLDRCLLFSDADFAETLCQDTSLLGDLLILRMCPVSNGREDGTGSHSRQTCIEIRELCERMLRSIAVAVYDKITGVSSQSTEEDIKGRQTSQSASVENLARGYERLLEKIPSAMGVGDKLVLIDAWTTYVRVPFGVIRNAGILGIFNKLMDRVVKGLFQDEKPIVRSSTIVAWSSLIKLFVERASGRRSLHLNLLNAPFISGARPALLDKSTECLEVAVKAWVDMILMLPSDRFENAFRKPDENQTKTKSKSELDKSLNALIDALQVEDMRLEPAFLERIDKLAKKLGSIGGRETEKKKLLEALNLGGRRNDDETTSKMPQQQLQAPREDTGDDAEATNAEDSESKDKMNAKKRSLDTLGGAADEERSKGRLRVLFCVPTTSQINELNVTQSQRENEIPAEGSGHLPAIDDTTEILDPNLLPAPAAQLPAKEARRILETFRTRPPGKASYKSLKGCTDKITTLNLPRGLLPLLTSRQVLTVGDLASKSVEDLSQLPFPDSRTVVSNCLERFIENKSGKKKSPERRLSCDNQRMERLEGIAKSIKWENFSDSQLLEAQAFFLGTAYKLSQRLRDRSRSSS